MLRTISTVAALAGVLTLGAASAAHASAARVVVATPSVAADSVSGCLQKGHKKGMYSVTDASGNKHWVMSAAVPLDKHVGQMVALMGTTMATDHKMMGDTGMKASGDKMDSSAKMDTSAKMDNSAMQEPMTVTSLKMISHSCK